MLTDETLADLEREAAEGGAAFVLCDELAELVRGYRELVAAKRSWGVYPTRPDPERDEKDGVW